MAVTKFTKPRKHYFGDPCINLPHRSADLDYLLQELGVDVGLLRPRPPLDAPLQQVEVVAADVDDEVGPDPLAHLRVHELEPLLGQGVLGVGDISPLPGKR